MKHITIFAALLSFCVAPALSQMQPPIPMTPDEFGRTTTGQPVKLLVRVMAFKRTALTGELLRHESGSVYKATGTTVDLYLPKETPIIMGSAADIKGGAILLVYGVATTPGHADIKKAVVDTAYLKVE